MNESPRRGGDGNRQGQPSGVTVRGDGLYRPSPPSPPHRNPSPPAVTPPAPRPPGPTRRVATRTLDRAAATMLAAFPDAVEEPDYVDPVGLYSAAYSPRDREALRRRIEALRGMRVVRADP